MVAVLPNAVLPNTEPNEQLPKLFGRWSTTRSYGPYGKSYASSSVDSDFESDSQSIGSQSFDSKSIRSELPDEYWPYSDGDYSDTETLTSDSEENSDENSDIFSDDSTSIASSVNEVEIEINNGTEDAWIDDELHPVSKNQVSLHRFFTASSPILIFKIQILEGQKIFDTN